MIDAAAFELPAPPPSRRRRPAEISNSEDAALLLLSEHQSILGALTPRSPADFRPLPALWSQRATRLAEAFEERDVVPPSLVGELAPLLVPRLERLLHRLRRRMARARKELPLRRLREMDPACLRTNARRPGRTLIEKAGPRGRLRGVVRIERFDTTENRVLKAACRRLAALSSALLAEASPEARERPTGRSLKRLRQAGDALIERPELLPLGPPRPGERPSNALLSDADYRAAWRAWKLLRREEARFVGEWQRLDQLALELVAAAAWAHVDRQGFEALPGWSRVLPDRGPDGRLEDSSPRRWLALGQEEAMLITLAPELDTLTLGLEISTATRSGLVDGVSRRWTVQLDTGGAEPKLAPPTEDGSPTTFLVPLRATGPRLDRHLIFAQVSAALGPLLPDGAQSGPHSSAGERPKSAGLSLLGRRVLRANGDGGTDLGLTAIGVLSAPDEAAMHVVGRQATWLPAPRGPSALVANEAGLSARLVERFGGLRETALVVPDRANEYELGLMRAAGGRTWTVWAPVAAALAAAELHDDAVPRPPAGETVSVVVAVNTDAAFDLVRLELKTEEQDGDAQRLWVRIPRNGHSEAGQEARAGVDDGTRGLWLREGWGGEGWDLQPTPTWRRTPPRPEPPAGLPPDWSGPSVPPVALRIAVGPVPSGLRDAWTDKPLITLEPSALALGGWTFLTRRAGGLPTWVERLPRLDLEVRRSDRRRQPVPLVPPDREVAPGDLIEQEPEVWFTLEPGELRIDFPLLRDGRSDPLVVRLEGPPLPLKEPVQVGVSLRFRHGLDGVEGFLVPRETVGFERIPFRLADGASVAASGEVGAPHWPPPHKLSSGEIERALASVEKVETALRSLNPKVRRAIAAGRQDAAAPVVEALLELSQTLRPVRGRVEAVAPPLEPALSVLLPRVDWLLGLSRPKGAGRAPDLRNQKPLHRAAAAVRAATTLTGTGAFGTAVIDGSVDVLDRRRRLLALARTVRGPADAAWRAVLDYEPTAAGAVADWAEAVEAALTAVPALAAESNEEDALALLERAVRRLELLAELDDRGLKKRKEDVDRLLRVITACTLLREAGWLAPSSPEVQRARASLQKIAERLPDDVRMFGQAGGARSEDETIRVAIDYLGGHYRSLPTMRDP